MVNIWRMESHSSVGLGDLFEISFDQWPKQTGQAAWRRSLKRPPSWARSGWRMKIRRFRKCWRTGLDTVGPCWTIFDIIWCQQGCCNFAVWRNDMGAFHWDWLTHWPSTIKFNNKKTYEKNKGLVSDVLGDADDCKQPSRTQEKIAKLGENIVIRRFTRLTLGEARYACRLQSCDRLRNTKKSKNATRFPILETTFHCVERLSQVRVRSGWN